MELESAARRYLLGVNEVGGYVANRIWKFRLEEPVEGLGLSAIVLSRGAGWASPQQVNSNEFPVLVVDCHADPTRAPGGEIRSLDGEDKANALARTVMRAFTYPNLHGVQMGAFGSNPGLLVISSQLWTLPEILTGGDFHPARGGDAVMVRTRYALNVAH